MKKRSKTFKVLVTLIVVLGVFELVAFGALAYYIIPKRTRTLKQQ